MKQPTQEDFVDWKASHAKEWGREASSEPRIAWIYLCHIFDAKGALCDRCCAENKCGPSALASCRNRKSPEVREAVEKINTLVQEFVHNGNAFPKLKDQNDRIKIVLEDLLLHDGESP